MRRQFKQLMQFLYAWTLILCLTQKLFAHVQVFIIYCDLGKSDVMVRYTACIRQLIYLIFASVFGASQASMALQIHVHKLSPSNLLPL